MLRWPSLAKELLDLVAPLDCLSCGEWHPTFPRGSDPALCGACASCLEPPEDPPAGVLVPYAHHGPLLQAVHRAKYGSTPAEARRIGTLLVSVLAAEIDRVEVVVPVPLHPRRLRERGFNQALEMARALGPPIEPRAIERTRDTRSQVGLGRVERLANVREAFATRAAERLRGRRVLLLDDVVTTGATLREAALAVLACEPSDVVLCALARAPLDRDVTATGAGRDASR